MRRDSNGRRIARFQNRKTGEIAQWQAPRYPGKCAAGCAVPISTRDEACLVKTPAGWVMWHCNCAPSWTYDPKNEI